jgi:hypothetical protein
MAGPSNHGGVSWDELRTDDEGVPTVSTEAQDEVCACVRVCVRVRACVRVWVGVGGCDHSLHSRSIDTMSHEHAAWLDVVHSTRLLCGRAGQLADGWFSMCTL